MMFSAVVWVHSSLMMEAVRTSETSVDNHFTRQYNPEDSSEHHYHYCEKSKLEINTVLINHYTVRRISGHRGYLFLQLSVLKTRFSSVGMTKKSTKL
jgi:hypothetical protein